MTREAKKEIERRALVAFLREVDLVPTSVEEREHPDFLVVLDGNPVAIEVVDTTVAALAMLEGTSHRLTSRLVEMLELRGIHADVSIFPHRNGGGIASLSAIEQREAVLQVVELAAELRAEALAGEARFASAYLVARIGPRGEILEPRARIASLCRIHVSLRDDESAKVWFGASASRIGSIAQYVREIVAVKEAKLARYRASVQAGACWILLRSDGRFSSAIFEEDVDGVDVESSFDAVGIVGPRGSSSADWARWLKRPARPGSRLTDPLIRDARPSPS